MHFFSLNDLLKTDNGSFTKVAEDLDKLCFKAFPRHNKEKRKFGKNRMPRQEKHQRPES